MLIKVFKFGFFLEHVSKVRPLEGLIVGPFLGAPGRPFWDIFGHPFFRPLRRFFDLSGGAFVTQVASKVVSGGVVCVQVVPSVASKVVSERVVGTQVAPSVVSGPLLSCLERRCLRSCVALA